MLVYNVNDMKSFQDIEQWSRSILDYADSRVIIILIGNKCDLNEREVPYNVGMEFARRNNFAFLETSAKTGINIQNAFTCLTREIYRNTSVEEEDDPKLLTSQQPRNSGFSLH